MAFRTGIWIVVFLTLAGIKAGAQGKYDTIRLGAITEHGQTSPIVFLPEIQVTGVYVDAEERSRRNRLRNDIFVVYPYALTAATIFKDVNSRLEALPDRHSRKQYLKSIDKKLDNTFKEPLKNLTIDQGHVLIKLINRQTGQDCYSIIKELKGGFSAVLWQGVGVFFNNNLRREYDPDDADKEMEGIVREMEASNVYAYQLYQQEVLLKKISKP
jgi:hypothetical protein